MFSVQGGETTKAELSDTVLAYVQVMEKLTALSKLRKNWDGYGAGPISPNTIDNVKAVALQQWLWNFSLWQIAPGVNGDIFINFKGKKKQASIVIGPDVFSYFVEDETSLEGEENLEFNGARISLLMNQIAYG